MRFARIMDSIKTLTEGDPIGNKLTSKPLNGIRSKPTMPSKAKKNTTVPQTGAVWGLGHKRLHEHTLIETIKKLAKDKNCKCDKKDNGDNPKGAPEGFELNPEINSTIQNR